MDTSEKISIKDNDEIGSTPTELDLLYRKMPIQRTKEEFDQIFAYQEIYSKLQDLTDVYVCNALNVIGKVVLEVKFGHTDNHLSAAFFSDSIRIYKNRVDEKISSIRVMAAAARKWVELTDEQKVEQLKLTDLLFDIKSDIYGMLHAKECLSKWPKLGDEVVIQAALDERTNEFVEAYKGFIVPSLPAYAYGGQTRLTNIGREGWDPTTVQYRVF